MTSADLENDGTKEVQHKDDALGRRVARSEGTTTTIFAQVGQQMIADYSAEAAPAQSTYRYLYASYIDEPVMRWQTSNGARVYYHRNQQYSIVALTDSSGNIVERTTYTAYGEVAFFDGSGLLLTPQSSLLNNRFTYTGREYDPTIHLYHYGALMYDPQLGRFFLSTLLGVVGSFPTPNALEH